MGSPGGLTCLSSSWVTCLWGSIILCSTWGRTGWASPWRLTAIPPPPHLGVAPMSVGVWLQWSSPCCSCGLDGKWKTDSRNSITTQSIRNYTLYFVHELIIYKYIFFSNTKALRYSNPIPSCQLGCVKIMPLGNYSYFTNKIKKLLSNSIRINIVLLQCEFLNNWWHFHNKNSWLQSLLIIGTYIKKL